MESVIGAILFFGVVAFIGYVFYVKKFSKTGKFFWEKK